MANDPALVYRQSDRDYNRRTFYLVVGLWLVLGGGMAMKYLGLG